MSDPAKRKEIREAIGAHGAWKLKLRTAARRGRRDLPVEEICRDDACQFGKWLATKGIGLSKDPHVPAVREMHTRFHAEAGRIAGLIRNGQDDKAMQALADGSGFIALSFELTDALSDWKMRV